MRRRTFISHAAAAAGSSLAAATSAEIRAAAPDAAAVPLPIIDTNISLGAHPFRGSITAQPEAFARKLEDQNVVDAWAGSFEALLQRDITAVNMRLAAACRSTGGLFKATGSIHPKLPGWRGDLKRCIEQHGMKAIRLHPNHHGYALDDPAFIEVLEAATANKLLVQLVAQMEDVRTQHPQVQLAPVDLQPLPALLEKVPQARVLILNANATMVTTALRGVSNVWLDFAMIEGVAGLEKLLKDWPLERVVFGSHAPFFYWHSARLKLQESDLTQAQLSMIAHDNAIRLLRG